MGEVGTQRPRPSLLNERSMFLLRHAAPGMAQALYRSSSAGAVLTTSVVRYVSMMPLSANDAVLRITLGAYECDHP